MSREAKRESLLAMAYFPQGVPPSVSSALGRFTSVFGMGTGGTTSLKLPGGYLTCKLWLPFQADFHIIAQSSGIANMF